MKTLFTTLAVVAVSSSVAFAGAPDCGEHQDLCDKAYALGDTNGWHNGINHQIETLNLYTQEEVTALVLEGQYAVIELYQADIEKLAAEKDAIIANLSAEYEVLLDQHNAQVEAVQTLQPAVQKYYNELNWLQADFDEYKAETNQIISNLKAKISSYREIAKHVVGWVKDYGPQSWIAEQANRMLKDQL